MYIVQCTFTNTCINLVHPKRGSHWATMSRKNLIKGWLLSLDLWRGSIGAGEFGSTEVGTIGANGATWIQTLHWLLLRYYAGIHTSRLSPPLQVFWGQNQFHVPDQGGRLKWCECWTSLRPGVAQPRQVTCDGLSSRQTFPSATNTWQGTRGAYFFIYFYQMIFTPCKICTFVLPLLKTTKTWFCTVKNFSRKYALKHL